VGELVLWLKAIDLLVKLPWFRHLFVVSHLVDFTAQESHQHHNITSPPLTVPSEGYLLVHLNLKTLRLKLAVLPYNFLGSAVLQQFLRAPPSWLPGYSSSCAAGC